MMSPSPPPLPKIVDREEEWVVEEILDSRLVNHKLRYLVKWEGFGIEHNSWEAWNNIHAPDLVADFHWKHSRAPRQICFIDFNNMAFYLNPPQVVLGRHSLEGGLDVRGHPPKLVSTTKSNNPISVPAPTSLYSPTLMSPFQSHCNLNYWKYQDGGEMESHPNYYHIRKSHCCCIFPLFSYSIVCRCI